MTIMGGRMEAAIADSREAFALSQSIGNAWGMSFSEMNLATAYWTRGLFDKGIAAAESCIQHGENSGFITGKLWSIAELGMMYGLLGQYERGLSMISRAVAGFADQRQAPFHLESYLCHIYLAMGSPDRAEEVVQRSLAAGPGSPLFKLFLTWGLNGVLVAKGDYARAVQSISNLVPALRHANFRLLLPDMLLALGQAQLALGQTSLARAALSEAQAEAEEMGVDWFLWQILAARAQLETRDGQAGDSAEYLSRARQIVRRIADGLSDPELKTSFLDRQVVRALIAEPVTD
jgi:tetratricopeptide (TPR) repeat protein